MSAIPPAPHGEQEAEETAVQQAWRRKWDDVDVLKDRHIDKCTCITGSKVKAARNAGAARNVPVLPKF